MTKSEKKVLQSDPVDDKNSAASLAELFSQAATYDYFLMMAGTIGGIVTGLSLPIFNVLFGKALDALNTNPNSLSTSINNLALLFVYIGCANLVSGTLQVACWSITGERQTQKFREVYVKSILSQEIGWFDICGAGELSTKVADLCGKISDGLGRKVGDLLQYASQVIGSFVIAFYFSWQLTLVLLATLPLISIAGSFMINSITAAQNESTEQYAAAGGLATETFGAIRTVTALNAQPAFITQYRKYLYYCMKVGIKKGLNIGLGNGSVFCACFITYALGFWYGGKLIADGINDGCKNSDNCITGGTILAVFFCVIMGSMAIGQLAPPLTAFVTAKAAAYPLLTVVRRRPLIDGLSEEGKKPFEKPKGHISFEEVRFAYPSRPDVEVCRGYNLDIKPGETMALVGASGCGKSTIVNLILRFYDIQSGCIRLDGMDIRELNVRWLRANIGYVGQEPVLFSGSITDNIAYGLDPTVCEEVRVIAESTDPDKVAIAKEMLQNRVESAAMLANAHEFIMSFPNGYHTDVGSNGVAMSGGQKQRIAIARALIKRPAVLLLDEATSALDAASERLVQESIDKLQQSKMQTTIVIAHRLTTIMNADKIAVINKGSIVELGRHEELLAMNNVYADLIRLQVTGSNDESHNLAVHDRQLTDALHEESKLTDGEENVAAIVDKVNLVDTLSSPAKVEEEKELDKDEKKSLSREVRALIHRQQHWFLLSVVGAAVFGSIFPVWGLFLAHTQNVFFYTDPSLIRQRVAELALFFGALAIISFFASIAQFYGMAQMGERIAMKLRSDLFEAVIRREIAFFDDEINAVGVLTTRLVEDSRTVTKATGIAAARQIQAFFTLTIGIILGFTASWKIAFVVLATFPVSIAASAIQMQAIAGQHGTDGSEDLQAGIISSAFTHMRTVAAFSVQFKIFEDYKACTYEACIKRISKAYVAGVGFGSAQLSMFLTYALLFWYGGLLIKSGQVTFVEMMTSILTLMFGALGLGMALNDIGDQKAGLKATKRIFETIRAAMNCPIDGLSQLGHRSSTNARGKIEFKDVKFRYPTRPDAVVCDDLSITIEPGEVVALVGPSGSGKSTIVNLLLRFYDPSSGEVQLDGTDIKGLNVRWLRSQIGYVGQEPALFTGSIAANIMKGRASYGDIQVASLEDAIQEAEKEERNSKFKSVKATGQVSLNGPADYNENYSSVKPVEDKEDEESAKISTIDEDVISAARDSNAHEFIMSFPNGYHTDVGSNGVAMSGGQKQRIAIARALIKRPAVLLLDEATSALDAASERLVQESIDKLQQSKMQTTIVIAHRLTTIMNADKIAVINKGSIVELGRHEELLAMNGLYNKLWNKQTRNSAS